MSPQHSPVPEEKAWQVLSACPPGTPGLWLSRQSRNFSARQGQLGGVTLPVLVESPPQTTVGCLVLGVPPFPVCVVCVVRTWVCMDRLHWRWKNAKGSSVSSADLGGWRLDSFSCHFSCRLCFALAPKLLSLACCFKDMSLSGQ